MTIRNLEIFSAVAELGSMSAAADYLYITQPSVSLAISDIEKEYKVKLFDRVGRKLHLTPAGKRLVGYSNGILRLNDEMEHFLANESHNPGIHVGASATVGACIMAPVIDELKKSIPDVKCDVDVANTKIIESELLKSELDIALVEGDVSSPELIVCPVIRDELMLVCSSKHRFYGRKTINLEELESENLILREVGSGTRAKLERAMASRHLSCNIGWSCYNFEAIKDAVIHNFGVTVASPRVAGRELCRGEMWACRIGDVDFSRSFNVVYCKNKFFTPTLLKFIEVCKNFKNFSID